MPHLLANICWRDNNRNSQIFGGAALIKVGQGQFATNVRGLFHEKLTSKT
jgi:hypothetical protein